MPYVPSEKTPLKGDIKKYEDREVLDPIAKEAAEAIAKVAAKYKYKGAFAGELNYFETRLLQHLPRALIKTGEMASELRYWFQAIIYGVQLDVALEHKLRVNKPYETAQIVKSGDCYDAPYRSQVVEMVTEDGEHVGYARVDVERSNDDGADVLTKGKIVIKKEG